MIYILRAKASSEQIREMLKEYEKENKLAENVAGVALAGEISLAAAISSAEWVSSHEQYGRNR